MAAARSNARPASLPECGRASLVRFVRGGEGVVGLLGEVLCTLLLHPECVRRLGVQIDCIFVLFCAAAEETETATCAL